jgi:NTP pyrophosphatase (non-canonical NTP hydrolase)
MSDAMDMVAEWHSLAGLPRQLEMAQHPHSVLDVGPNTDTAELHLIRSRLLGEESREAMDAIVGWDPKTGRYHAIDKYAVAKEFADVLYVVYGAADAWAIPLDEVLKRVHASNLTKLGPRQQMRSDGKVTKGPDYVPPVLTDLF